MALTPQQRADVRNSLGWSAQFAQTDNALENAFDGLETQPEHETQIIALLADISAVKLQIVDARKRLKGLKVGSIELDAFRSEMTALRWDGQRLTGEMASIMGVERRHDIFSSGTPGRQGWYGPTGGSDSNYF